MGELGVIAIVVTPTPANHAIAWDIRSPQARQWVRSEGEMVDPTEEPRTEVDVEEVGVERRGPMVAGVPQRPGRVTFTGVLLYIYGFLAVAAAVTLIVGGTTDRVQTATGLSYRDLFWSGIWEAVIAVALFIVGAAVLRGASWARLLVAIVVGIRMTSAVALMLLHHTSAYVENGVVALLIGALILWTLYSDEADRYFTQMEARTSV